MAIEPASDSGYMVVGGYNGISGNSNIYARKVDKYGNSVAFYNLVSIQGGYTDFIWGKSLKQINDGTYTLIGSVGLTSLTRKTTLLNFSEDGQINWQQTYEIPDTLTGNMQLIITPDNGYLLVGWANAYNAIEEEWSYTKFYVVKTDSIGNRQWTRTYTYTGQPIDVCYAHDGGYIISGGSRIAGGNYDMTVIKIDSIGGLVWQRNFGNPTKNDGACATVPLTKKKYLVMGAIADTEPTGDFKSYFAILDSMGYTIFEKITANGYQYGAAAWPIVVKDKVVVPMSISNYDEIYNLTRFTIFSMEGDVLYEQPIDTGLPAGNDYLRDFQAAPDGGYVMAGFNYAYPQSSWILKVDSLGNTCGIANCDNYVAPVGINPPNALPQQTMLLYPNPTNSKVQITFVTQQACNTTLELRDLTGRLVLFQKNKANSGTNTATIDLSPFAQGLYVVSLNNGKNIITAKVVKQ